MWSLRNRGRRDDSGTALAEWTGAFQGTDDELRLEIDRLSALNRSRPASETERTLLHLRNQLGIRLLEADPDDSGHPDPDFESLPGSGLLPELEPQALTPELLRAGILRHGCVLVRGLVPQKRAKRFAAEIERSFAERERHDAGARFDDRYFSAFEPDPRYGESLSRQWIKSGGGLLAVDSPQLNFQMVEMFSAAGLPELVRGYLREPALVTADKTTLRRADPSVRGAWHQDGKFMGDVKALNLWLSLSHCGDDAPGLDLVPLRLEHHVRTQTDEAWLDNMVSQRMAEEAAGDTPILRPIFEPGDAVLFDELFLHKTASEPEMDNPRYSIENWFFGASRFPADYAPLAV
jgi:hypothetical protein